MAKRKHTPAKKPADVQVDDPSDPLTKTSADPPMTDPPSGGATEGFLQSFPPLSRIISVAMLVLGIAGVGLLFYRVMAGFFVPLFLAALLVVIFRPIHEWIVRRSGGRYRLASIATTSLILMIVLLPLMFLMSIAAGQFTAMIRTIDSGGLQKAFDRGRNQLGLAVPHPEYFRKLDEVVDHLQITDPAKIDTSLLLQAVDIVKFLQTDETLDAVNQAEAAQRATQTIKTLTQLIADIATLQSGQIAAGQIGEDQASGYLRELDYHESLTKRCEEAATLLRTWMQTSLGGSMWGTMRLTANLTDEDYANLIRSAREFLQPRFVQLTSRTGGVLLTTLIGMVVLIISVYFFLIDGPSMIRTLMRLSPLDDNYERRLLLEFDRTSRAVVLASVLSALAQGVLAAIAFFVCGFDKVVLLFLATTVMALVPFLGAASVWVPSAIWLGAVDQRWTAAIALAIFGALVISSIDNVIKVFVLHGRSQLHPLLALLSVLGGISVFGPIGILVGPMVVVFLQTLLEILNHELNPHASTANARG